MDNLQIFKNEEFGEIREVEIEGKQYFAAVDIARALGYSNTRDAISRHCKGVVKRDGVSKTVNQHGVETDQVTEMAFISEGDIYRLVVRSQLPGAERFEAWVFDEVLPSIRQNGGYIANQEQLTPEQIVANALVVAQKIIQQKDRQLADLKPKAEFFDAVAGSKSAIAIGDVAKTLGIDGIGRNNLFQILRDRKILMRDNKPYQQYIDAGYFRVIEQKYDTPDGETKISFKTLVFQKGVDYIRKVVGGAR